MLRDMPSSEGCEPPVSPMLGRMEGEPDGRPAPASCQPPP